MYRLCFVNAQRFLSHSPTRGWKEFSKSHYHVMLETTSQVITPHAAGKDVLSCGTIRCWKGLSESQHHVLLEGNLQVMAPHAIEKNFLCNGTCCWKEFSAIR
jgi:hypothetical protein